MGLKLEYCIFNQNKDSVAKEIIYSLKKIELPEFRLKLIQLTWLRWYALN